MKSTVLAAFLLSASAFAQDAGLTADSGLSQDAGEVSITMSSPIISLPDGGVKLDVQAEVSMVKTVFTAVKTGNWWLAAGAFLVLVVSLLRTAGKKFHEWLPDNNILDKPLIFIYDTKVGGWILNWLTATAGGLGTAMMAGVAIDFSLWKSVVMVSTSASALFELYSDIMEWWKNRKAAVPVQAPTAPVPAPAPAAPVTTPVEPPKP
jgi:hypothetical protein